MGDEIRISIHIDSTIYEAWPLGDPPDECTPEQLQQRLREIDWLEHLTDGSVSGSYTFEVKPPSPSTGSGEA